MLCSFAVGCEDSEDTGFCPLRIMWCAPEQPRVLESAKQAASETFSFATNRNYSISHCFVIRYLFFAASGLFFLMSFLGHRTIWKSCIGICCIRSN